MDNKAVGQRIRSIRKKLGMTTDDLGKVFEGKHASKGTVSKWENGHYLPNNERLKKIAELGEMSVDELLFGQRNIIIKNAINDSLREYKDSFETKDKKKDFVENKKRYEELLAGLYEEYSNYPEFVLPTDNLYINVRNMALKELNDEYLKGSRTNESSLIYLRNVLEETHITVSKYEHDPLTKKAIEDGKISSEIFKNVIDGLIQIKKRINENLESISNTIDDKLE